MESLTLAGLKQAVAENEFAVARIATTYEPAGGLGKPDIPANLPHLA